jgi:3'-phosphoadenosine 5'-phosphosulfate sulfotransferase (PAPS reductase)/FAD synthetase
MFMDTGWELPETYDYLDTLERHFGKIHRIATWVPGPRESRPDGFDFLEPLWSTPGKVMDGDRWAMARVIETRIGRYSPMVRMILQWGKVPTSVRRWCTADLKLRPVVAFMKTLNDPVNSIGIRADESHKRATQPAWEWAPDFDAWIYRPIKWWTKADRVEIHQRHNLAPNPLYLKGKGAKRVGCRICVNSGKEDLRQTAEHHPETIDILAEIETFLAEIDAPRERAMVERGASDEHPEWGHSPRWFTLSLGGKSWMVPVPVHVAVEWANTTRGGRQQMLFRPQVDSGCSVWGLCDVGGDAWSPA